MKKVYLGVGHGGKDSGAVGYLVEKDVNLQMALACKEYLEANGVEVKISRTSDIDKDLKERIKECNEYGPDLAVDVHNNAGGGDGFEVYHTLGGGTGKVLAQKIEEEVKAIGQNSRGLKTKSNSQGKDYFGFIRQIECPYIITETVFVDNQADASQADTVEEQRMFGQAIAKGILKTLDITSNNTPVVESKPVQTKSKRPSNDYEVFVGEVQKACGAELDYIAGPKTLSKTITVSAKKNRYHAVVTALERYLKILGYYHGRIEADYGEKPNFGSGMTTAVKNYQRDHDCKIDGEITAGRKTWKKLLKLA